MAELPPSKPAPPPPAEAVARFCLSCAGTCACWGVWLVLGALLAVQIYVVAAQELPVPDFVLRRIDARLAEYGFAANFRSAQFDPSGKLLLEGVRLRSQQFEDPLLTASSVYVRKSIWSVFSGDRAPDEIVLDGALLQLPAPLSPSGMATPLVEKLAATVRLGDSLVHIDQLAFRVGNVAVLVRGDYQLPPARSAEKPDVPALVQRVLQHARRFARELPQLEVLDTPTLTVDLSVRPGIGNVAVLHLAANGWRETPRVAVATGPLVAQATLRLDGADARPLRLAFAAQQFRYGTYATTPRVHGEATLEFTPGGFVLHGANAQFATGDLAAFDETAQTPIFAAKWRRDEPLHFDLSVAVDDEPMTLHGVVDFAARSAEAQFDGRVAPSIVSSVLPVRAPKFAPYFHFGDPVTVHGRVAFAPGWKFDGLWTHVRAGRLNSSNVQITSARGRIDIDADGNFLAHEADVVAGENYARGSYWMNFRSLEFRILLTGALKPPHIAGWFRSDWWSKFWENFEFEQPPRADVDVAGFWRDASRTYYFGSTDTGAARVQGADFEQAHARVFVRPHFAHAFDLRVARARGDQQARGWFKRIADPETRELAALEYDLSGNLEPVTLRRLGGPLADTLLKPWVFGRPPAVAFAGRTKFVGGESIPDVSFSGSIASAASYEGFPLETLEVRGQARGDRVELEQLRLGVAGGRGAGKATLAGEGERRRLQFDFQISDADMVRTIGALAEFNRARHPNEAQASPNRELLKRASGGKLQFALAAQGNPSDIASFDGQGNVQLTGAELGEIHLFGLLSQLLSGLSLNFSSMKLDTLRSNFRVTQGVAHFPDLRVTGSTAVIEAKGDYRLNEQTLDFTARLKPYEENRNIFTAAIGIVINPLTSILELRLTGPLKKPDWSISLGSSSTRETPATPPPAAPPEKSAAPAPKPEARSEKS